MKIPAILRTVSPTGWLLILALSVVGFVGLGLIRPTFLGLQFDPFGMDARTIDRLATERETAASDSIARGLEVEGEREQAQRIDTFHRQEVVIRDFTSSAETSARSAPDANDPLDSDRASRLRGHDQRLCDAQPRVCGAAAPVDAGGGPEALPAGRAAR